MISSPESETSLPSRLEPTAADALVACDEVVCHCLQVTASAVRLAVDLDGCRTVGEVVGCTEAGTGCTACHRRIAELIQEAAPPAVARR